MQVQTSCKGCLFAEYTENTQTGCQLNRADKLNPKNDLILDGEEYHYTFSRFCNTYRPEEWKLVLSDEEKDNMQKAVMREVCPKVGFFILVKNDHEGLERSIKSILNQEIFSAKYILISSTYETDQIEIIQKTQSILEGTEIPYKVQRILEEEVTDDQFIDLSFSNAKNGYYCVLECGHEIPTDLIKILHKALVFDLYSVAYVEGYEGINGRRVQCAIHKFLIGNKGATIKTKILEGEDYDKQQAKSELRSVISGSMI